MKIGRFGVSGPPVVTDVPNWLVLLFVLALGYAVVGLFLQ